MIRYTIDIPPHVAMVIQRLPPDIKQSVKAAVRALADDPHLGIPLERDLAGLYKYRVRRYRIVYAIHHRQRQIRIHAFGHRKETYARPTTPPLRRNPQ